LKTIVAKMLEAGSFQAAAFGRQRGRGFADGEQMRES
jgi:hypothetical protein